MRLCHVHMWSRWPSTVLQSTTMATARLDTAGIVVDGKNSKQVGFWYINSNWRLSASTSSDCLPTVWVKDSSSKNGLLWGWWCNQLQLKNFFTKETEFELQSMKKETVGTAELLDQFYRVEVGLGLGLGYLLGGVNNCWIYFYRAHFCRICLISTTWGSQTRWSI